MEHQIKKGRVISAMLLLAALLLALPQYIYAETNTGDMAEYSAILYDRNSGLPTSEANAIAQTGNGFLWIGSYSGLIRYDGNDFVRYNPEVGIASVMSLYTDSKDRLWIGTNDSGAALYENGSFRFYGKTEGLESLSVRAIAEDDAGNIILATTKGLAYIDGENELHPLSDVRLDGEYIRDVISGGDGVLYGITSGGVFFTIENLQIVHLEDGTRFGTEISCICPNGTEAGTVYLGTWDSRVITYQMETGEYRSVSVAPQTNINRLFEKDDRLWVCADNGIGYLEKDGGYHVLDNIPMNNSVDDMMTDYEGNLWFVSSRQGVMEITSSPFTDVSRLAGLDSMVVNSTCLYRGDLYIGTDRGLVLLDDRYHRRESDLTELLQGVRIRCIKADQAGKLWLCTYGETGLVCYDGNTITTYNADDGLASNWVRAMTELSDGSIAVAASGGLTIIRDGRIERVYGKEDGIENTEILTVCDGGDGRLYLGSDGDGIYILENGSVSRIGLEDGLKSEIILRIKKDPNMDLYWIITSNSISYLENGAVRTLTNFPYSNNFDMYFSNSGEMWVLSSNGIYVVDSRRLLTDEKPEYTFYDFQCGLPYVATANSRSCVSEDGVLYISGTAGVSSICIDADNEGERDIRLCVPFVGIDDRTVMVQDGETVVIPANCRRLTIYGYALTYTLHNPHLSYRLEGFDEETVQTTGNEMEPVSYTNLAGGEYVFHLSVINARTGEAEYSIAVKIRKEKAFYEQVWFWIAIGLALLAAAVGASHVYAGHMTANLVKKQEENRLFISQLTSAFAKSIDLKDQYTKGHSFRVAAYSKLLAERMGYDREAVAQIYHIALLHDIGKLAVPDEILNKAGKLTEEEYAAMKLHASNGYDILKEIEIEPELALGAGYHHERIDGKGYPSGKTGEEIPMVAQIIAVADTFDAMNSTRPYRKQMAMEDIKAELERVAGTQLNKEIVTILLALIEEGAFA